MAAASANIWAERFGSPAAPGPGIWQRDREHGRVMSDQISSYIGSDEHRATKILKDRFGSGDTRGWGRWTPEGHEPWPKTSVGGGGRGGGKRVMVGKINWSQGTYPCPPEAPPLGISPSTTLEQLLPLLSDVAAERTLFSQKPWRRDLAEWDERTKPAAIAEHRRLQAVNVCALSDAELWAHVERTMANSHMAGALHGHFGAAFGAPVNVFLAQVATWIEEARGVSGAAEARVLVDCLAGSSMDTVIAANPASIAAAEAILASPEATALLQSEDLTTTIEQLRAHSEPEVKTAVEEWAQHVGSRLIDGHTGFATPQVLCEVPRLYVGLLRHCVATVASRRDAGQELGGSPVADVATRAAETAKGWIPDRLHTEFDDLLAEARTTYKLRDERVNYADAAADGITRLAFLEVGRRLQERGLLKDPVLAMEGHPTQLCRMLLAPDTVDAAALEQEMATLAAERRASVHHHAPPTLVGPEEGVPGEEAADPSDPAAFNELLAAMSPEQAGTLRQLDRYNSVRKLLEVPVDAGGVGDSLKGVGVSGGVFVGEAIVGVMGVDVSPEDLDDKTKVFVTAATSSPFNLVIPMIGALVCDGGSLLSHPSITAREHGTPCVVGVVGCCAAIRNGDRVRVDADRNVVERLPSEPTGP